MTKRKPKRGGWQWWMTDARRVELWEALARLGEREQRDELHDDGQRRAMPRNVGKRDGARESPHK